MAVSVSATGSNGDGVTGLSGAGLEGCTFSTGLSGIEVVELVAQADGAVSRVSVGDLATMEGPFSVLDCRDLAERSGFLSSWPVGDSPPRPASRALAEAALASVRVPALTLGSAPDGVDAPHVVGLPTWWWIDSASWVTESGSASLGPASITATLTPSGSVWSIEGASTSDASADGSVACGRGVVWEPGLAEGMPGWCGLVFEAPAGPGGLPRSVTVSWDVSFSCVPAAMCAQIGVFDPVTVTVRDQIRVVEVVGVRTS